jgi:hypothetical protein
VTAAMLQQGHLSSLRFSAPHRSSSEGGVLTMGIRDHRRTWRFQINGSPQECVTAFSRAFTERGSGGVFAKAKWDIRQSDGRAVAIYRGRAGLIKGVTMLSSTATSEEQAAIGSEVTFEVERVANGAATCAMWLSSGSSTFGFTNDGRFFRPYMRAVEGRLRQVDPDLSVTKS